MEKNLITPKKSRIFIDADAFVAAVNSNDSNHKKALIFSKYIKAQKFDVVTSNFAIGEAITVISQKTGLAKAIEFGMRIYQGEVLIINVDRAQQMEALGRLRQQNSKNTRFTDLVNMVLMDDLKIDIIFSFDKHYEKAGYRRLGMEEKVG